MKLSKMKESHEFLKNEDIDKGITKDNVVTRKQFRITCCINFNITNPVLRRSINNLAARQTNESIIATYKNTSGLAPWLKKM